MIEIAFMGGYIGIAGLVLLISGIVLLGMFAVKRFKRWRNRRRVKRMLDEKFAQIIARASR